MSSTRRDAPHSMGSSGWSSKFYLPIHDVKRADDSSPVSRLESNREFASELEAGSGPFLSVVVPAKNEAASLPILIAEIVSALRPLCGSLEITKYPLEGFEIIIVDDGSTDETQLVLERLRYSYPELVSLSLTQNVGQSAAIAAGFRSAKGDWIATLDADLQNDPADLVLLWKSLPGHDVALGWRMKREDVWTKRVISRWANRIRNLTLGQAIRDTGCSVRIFRKSMALRLPMFHGAHRFMGPLLLREGCQVIQVPVNHRARPHGSSHYSFRNRSFKVVIDLLGVAWLMRRPVQFKLRGNVSHESLPHRSIPGRTKVGQAVPCVSDSTSNFEARSDT